MSPPEVKTVLGLSAGFHDASAALVIDGKLVAAVEQERLSRCKHDASFPGSAADVCLRIAGIDASAVDLLAFHEKPLDVAGRHLAGRLRSGPHGLRQLFGTTPKVLRSQIAVGARVRNWFTERGATVPPVVLAEHHVSHAAAAFYPSPFTSAAILTVDGVGEAATSTIGWGANHRLHLEQELRYPHSLGLVYSAFTAYCGFRVNGGEGELMGLAPFGEPRYASAIFDRLVDVHDDGSIRVDQRYFDYVHGRRTTNRNFHRLFGGPPRPIGSRPGRREADLAASIQLVTEEVVLAMAQQARSLTGADALCLGGGVALNCVANGRLARTGPFSEVWVQPAAGDAGNAVGSALWAWHEVLGNDRDLAPDDGMSGGFLGPSFGTEEITSWLQRERIEHRVLAKQEMVDEVAARLADGQVVGWFQGRMEFGPRALGHRSILADARSSSVQQRINSLIKERAGFRPFAPAVLADQASDWFDHPVDSPYMTFVAPVAARRRFEVDDQVSEPDDLEAIVAQTRSEIPAITHVDGSARLQTVDPNRNPEFAQLLEAFHRQTGCPVLLNTSFNAGDEPIVCSPDDAVRTFRRTGLDLLVLENCLVESE